jgi:hypothetical protein
MDITSLIVEAISGAVGGNVAGAAMKEKSLGPVGNSNYRNSRWWLGRNASPDGNGDRGNRGRFDESGDHCEQCRRRRRRWSYSHDRCWPHQKRDGEEIILANGMCRDHIQTKRIGKILLLSACLSHRGRSPKMSIGLMSALCFCSHSFPTSRRQKRLTQ